MEEKRQAQNNAVKMFLPSLQAPPHVPEKSFNEGIGD
jgi:hypothetical protein